MAPPPSIIMGLSHIGNVRLKKDCLSIIDEIELLCGLKKR